jgi:hypothetical protein
MVNMANPIDFRLYSSFPMYLSHYIVILLHIFKEQMITFEPKWIHIFGMSKSTSTRLENSFLWFYSKCMVIYWPRYEKSHNCQISKWPLKLYKTRNRMKNGHRLLYHYVTLRNNNIFSTNTIKVGTMPIAMDKTPLSGVKTCYVGYKSHNHNGGHGIH